MTNPWWPPPEGPARDADFGVDAWFDLWIDDDGEPVTDFGIRETEAPLADLRRALQDGLAELLAGQAKRWRREPVDLEQPVALIRVARQRDGHVSCGWGRFAEEPIRLRPLRGMAEQAKGLLEVIEAHPYV